MPDADEPHSGVRTRGQAIVRPADEGASPRTVQRAEACAGWCGDWAGGCRERQWVMRTMRQSQWPRLRGGTPAKPDTLSIATFSCLWCLEANAWNRMHSYLGCSPGARPLRGADVVSMMFRQRGCNQLAARSSRRDVLASCTILWDACKHVVQRAALLHPL